VDVNVIVGPAFSTQGLAIEELCREAQTPIIVTGTSPAFSTLENEYLFRGRSSDTIMGGLAMTFIINNLGLGQGKTIGVLYNNNDFGVGGFGVVSKYAEENGMTVVGQAYNTDDTDVTAQVTSLKSANCDAIVVWSSGGAVPVAARAIFEQGIAVPVVGSAAVGQNSVLATAAQWVNNWYCVSDCVLTKEDPAIQKFVADYTAKYGSDVLTYESAVAYSMVYLVADAYTRAGSTDPQAFQQALQATSGTDVLIGKYHKFDNIEMFSGGAIGQIKDGVVQYISNEDTMME
jgi:branched-chain amino acid transport system substrate-binding protein